MTPKFLKNKPTKIVAVGLNYKDHAKELKMDIPDHPIIFIKPTSSLIGPNENIIIPEMSKRVDYEGELSCVIGKKIKDISEKKVLENIEGFMCLNDVTARDLQQIDGQWTRSKSFDTFCPVGPRLANVDDPNNLKIQSILNGKVVQDSNTRNFIFKLEEVVSFISKIMTLYPGDIITTGTPPGVGKMKKGDKIIVKIQGIGKLENYVR